MPAEKRKEFDAELFLKCVRHFDNPNVNERDAFILRALKQCADCELLFYGALRMAFGDGGDDRELRERLSAVEAENARLEDENSKLRDGVQALNEELGQQQERQGTGVAGFVGQAWSMPQVRAGLLSGLIAARLWLALAWGNLPWWANAFYEFAVAWSFVKWNGRQFEQAAIGAPALNLVVFVAGGWLPLTVFFGGIPWLDWFRVNEFDANAFGGFAVLLIAALVTLSSLAERLAGLTASSGNRVFEILRWWFARPA